MHTRRGSSGNDRGAGGFRWWYRMRLLGGFAAVFLGICLEGAEAIRTGRTEAPVRWVAKSWRTEQGMPINSVSSLAQTADGYLWVGTGNGVARFDGVQFKVFGLPEGLGSISVSCLRVDHAGRLWVGTFGGGLSRWNGTRFETWTRREGLAGDNIVGLAEDAEGALWVGTWTGLSCWRADRFTNTTAADGLEDHQVQALTVDREGTLWVATSPGGLFQRRDGRFQAVAGLPGVPMGNARSLFGDREGRLWVGMDNGPLLCRQREEWTVPVLPVAFTHQVVNAMAQGAEGTLWAGTGGQGVLWCRQGQFESLPALVGLAGEAVTAVLADGVGNVWVGTRRQGLHRLTQARVTQYASEEGLPADKALSVTESPDGTLWVGTLQNGLYRQTGERFETFDMGPGLRPSLAAFAVCATRDGSLWWGENRGVSRWQPGQTAGFFEPEQFGSVEAVRALAADPAGGLWVGTALGRVLRLRDGQLQLVTDQLAGRFVTCLAVEPKGTVWIGTGGGLYHFADGAVSAITRDEGLLSNGIRALHLEADGTLWIGTAGGGLSRWREGRLRTFTTAQGLPDNIISQILQDEAGDYWFGCSRGIFRVRRAELRDLEPGRGSAVRPLIFQQADGMAAEECSGGFHPSCARTRSGLLCFTTTKGLVVIDPAKLQSETELPQVRLEELIVDGQPIALGSESHNPRLQSVGSGFTFEGAANGTPSVVIPPGQRRLEIHYTGLGARIPERTRFRYRLEGVDPGWVDAGVRRIAVYGNVPPGKREFSVEACNGDGPWNEMPVSLELMIQPHYWQTGWFHGGFVLLLMAGSGAGVWAWSRAHIQRAHEREHAARAEAEVQQQRQEILHLTRVATLGELSAALAHELNQPLTAILSNAQAAQRFLAHTPVNLQELREILQDIVTDDQRAGDVIRRLRALLQKGETQSQVLDLNEVIRAALKLMHSDFVTRHVAVVAELDPDLPLVRADPIQLQQVFLNLALNACDAMGQRPPPTRTLTVRSRVSSPDEVRVEVVDTGSGIAVEELDRIFRPFFTTKSHGLGMGLSLSHSIVLAHGGRLWATNNPEGGATLHFTLPAAQ